jgi:DNA-binding transcriptional LysR family regulator
MDLDYLRAFLAVVEEGHFGAAANRLRLSQPTLSRRIQRLELDVGHELLVRAARPIVPSSAGRILADDARTMIEAADHATSKLQALADGHGGHLRIGYVQSATFGWVTRLLAVARRQDIKIELVASPTIRQLRALQDHRLDAGLVRPASADTDLGGLRSVTLSQNQVFAVLPETHPLARSEWLRSRDLVGQLLVLYPEREGPGLRRLLDSWLASRTPIPVQDAWDAQSAVTLAGAGVGVAILPGDLPPLPTGMVARPLHDCPRLDLSLVWHPAKDPIVSPIRKSLEQLTDREGGSVPSTIIT